MTDFLDRTPTGERLAICNVTVDVDLTYFDLGITKLSCLHDM